MRGRCIIKDIAKMGGCKADCAVHGENCCIPSDLFAAICGFSCKDFSKLNNRFAGEEKADRSAVLNDASNGTTASTFKGTLAYLSSHQPFIYIGENLEDLITPHVRAQLLECFNAIGYVCDVCIIKSHEKGARTTRKRAWIVALCMDACGCSYSQGKALIHEIFSVVELMEVEPVKLDSVLLPHDHPYISGKFYESTKSAKRGEGGGSGDWRVKLRMALEANGIRWSELQVPEEHRAAQHYDLLCERDRLTLAHCMLTKPGASGYDISQQAGRCPTYEEGMFGCLTPGAKIWWTERKGLITGLEMMKVHGFPDKVFEPERCL